MTHTTAARRETPDELRARIPGWGADSDRANRPAVPREFPVEGMGLNEDLPVRQPEHRPRERSIEHGRLTPVFGTSVPLRGLSGVVRRYAYARFSEARAAHWLLLIAGDRIDVVESRLGALARLRPDDPITETGVLSEFRNRAFASRFGSRRVDLAHAWLDPIIVVGPTLVTVGVGVALVRRVLRRR